MEFLDGVLFLSLSATFSCAASQHSSEPCSEFDQRRDPIPGSCFVAGEKGACTGENLIFAHLGNYGDNVNVICDCNYHIEVRSRRLIYRPNTDGCYWMSSKGPCCEGEWFAFNNHGQGNVSQAGVLDSTSKKNLLLHWPDGKCYERGIEGHPYPEGYFVDMVEGSTFPQCMKIKTCPETFPLPVACFPGHCYDYLGGCRKTFKNPTNEDLCGFDLKWHPVKQTCVVSV